MLKYIRFQNTLLSFRNIIIGISLFFTFVSQTFAFDIPDYDEYLTDTTGVISTEDEIIIETKITEIEANTTAEIAVLIIPTTGDEDIAVYAFEVGQEWGVGKKENNNGLVIVIAVDDRKWFMATGYGLEGTLPDAIVKRIGERQFPPNFREGNYAQGILDALEDINGYLIADPTVVASYDYSSSNYDSNQIFQDESTWFGIILTLALFLIPLKAAWVRKEKKKKAQRSILSSIAIFMGFTLFSYWPAGLIMTIYSLITDWIDLDSTGSSGGSSSSSGSSWSSGSGWSSSSSSSSFGGFSGGSFGGGGAGGGW